MKDPTQIAAEAAREVRSYFCKPYYPTEYGNDKVLAIIQAAIEKAVEQQMELRQGQEDRHKHELEVVEAELHRLGQIENLYLELLDSRAAHASGEQEDKP